MCDFFVGDGKWIYHIKIVLGLQKLRPLVQDFKYKDEHFVREI